MLFWILSFNCLQYFFCSLLVHHHQNNRSQSTTTSWSCHRRGDPTDIKDLIWRKAYCRRHTYSLHQGWSLASSLNGKSKTFGSWFFWQNRHEKEALTLTDQGDLTDRVDGLFDVDNILGFKSLNLEYWAKTQSVAPKDVLWWCCKKTGN